MQLRAARAIRPGKILERELIARDWTQIDLAEIMGRPVQAINEIMRGAKQITPKTAHELAEVFGTSPEFWMNLETDYRLHLAQQQRDSGLISRKSRLYELAPVKELIKRRWIPQPGDLKGLERAVCTFLEIDSPEDTPQLALSRRHTRTKSPANSAQMAVIKRGKHLARSQRVGRFTKGGLGAVIPTLLELSQSASDVARVPRLLLKAGVHFVIIPRLPQSYLDGAMFQLNGNPVILLTLRYDRIDSFWFTLLHELGHVSRGHRGVYLDNLDDDEDHKDEEEANRVAADWLIDEAEFNTFVARTRPFFSRNRIISFANSINRHPGIVLGRLHRTGAVPYKNLRALLEKVSPFLGKWIDQAGN